MKVIIAASLLATGCYSSDENLGFTAIGQPRWAVSLGGRSNDQGMAIAVDSIGDVWQPAMS